MGILRCGSWRALAAFALVLHRVDLAAAAPVLSTELALEPRSINSFAQRDQRWQAMASNGSEYLVAWTHDRWQQEIQSDIIATRVDSAGNVLDPEMIRICTQGDSQSFPAITSNGRDYLVVWMDSREGSSIYGARVTAAGVVQDPNGFAIATTSGSHRTPQAACSGREYLVIWTEHTSSRLLGARVSFAGELLDQTAIAISAPFSKGRSSAPKIGSNGQNYLVSWQDIVEVNGVTTAEPLAVRVSLDGTVLDQAAIPLRLNAAASEGVIGIVAAEQEYFVALTRTESGIPKAAQGLRLNTSGERIGQAMPAVTIGTGTTTDFQLTKLVDGMLLTWAKSAGATQNLWGMKLHPDGSMREAAQNLTPETKVINSRVAASSSRFLATWVAGSLGSLFDSVGLDVFGGTAPASAPLAPLTAQPFSLAAAAQYDSSAAWSGSKYLAVWHELSPGDRTFHQIRAMHLTASGVPLGAAMTLPSSTNNQQGARVAASGGTFLAVWREDVPMGGYNRYALYAARIGAPGVASQPERIPIFLPAENAFPRALQYDLSGGTNGFLVSWLDGDRAGVHARLLPSIAAGATAPISIAADGETYDDLATAFNGDGYLVVWSEGLSIDRRWQSVLLNAQGEVTSDPNWFGSPSATASDPDLVWNGAEYLLVWSERAITKTDILGLRLGPDGQAIDGTILRLAATADEEFVPKLAWNGEHYLLKWDMRAGPRLQRFTALGETLDAQPFAFVSSSLHTMTLPGISTTALAAGPEGVLLLCPAIGDEFSARLYARMLLDHLPVTFSRPLFSEGQFGFQVDAEPGGTLLLESSEDLGSWSLLQTIENFNGPLLHTGPAAAKPRQYFRARKR